MHVNEGSRGKSEEDDVLTSNGIRLHDTNAQMMQTNDNYEKAMYLMGFDKYVLSVNIAFLFLYREILKG